MFSYPATELFTAAGDRRVVWSLEEYEQAMKDGHTAERPEKKPVAGKKAKAEETK
jgi:hypothetical protein